MESIIALWVSIRW